MVITPPPPHALHPSGSPYCPESGDSVWDNHEEEQFTWPEVQTNETCPCECWCSSNHLNIHSVIVILYTYISKNKTEDLGKLEGEWRAVSRISNLLCLLWQELFLLHVYSVAPLRLHFVSLSPTTQCDNRHFAMNQCDWSESNPSQFHQLTCFWGLKWGGEPI